MLVARIYETKLLKEGYLVGLAFDGREGLEMIYNTNPDLALIDLNLPNVSGVEVIRELRASVKFASLPVIAYSADEKLLNQVRQYNPTGIISKNELSPKEIIEHIKSAFESLQTWEVYEPTKLSTSLEPVTEEAQNGFLRQMQRVLIVEDDPVISAIVKDVVEDAGYEVVSAKDGREAYQILSKDANFVAGIFDVEMPYIKGPDLIRYMRTEKRLANIPVMIMTSEQSVKVQLESFAAGAIVFLPKPFTRNVVEKMFKMLVATK